MQPSDLLATVEQLCTTNVDTLDREELATAMADTALVRGWLDALELRCARRGRALADAGRAEPAPALIARHANRTTRDADQIARRDRVAEAMPTFETGLDNGTVSAGHLDAIAAATRNAPPEVRAAFAVHEDELLTHAAADTIDTFTRRCRALVAELTTEHTGNDATELDRLRAASSIRTWIDHDDGLHHTHAALDPLRHDIFWTALNRSIRRRQQRDGNARTPWNQIQVDALIDTVTDGTATPDAHAAPAGRPATSTQPPPCTPPATETTTPPTADVAPSAPDPPPGPQAAIARDLIEAIDRSNGHAPTADAETSETAEATDADLRRIEARLPEIHVITDHRTLVDGLHEAGICETEDGKELPVSTLRRLCCDADIIPIVLGGNSVPLDVGRASRTVTPGQRRALRSMHRTCINPDCSVPFSHTKIHHVRFWTRDTGPTDIANLVPLCDPCHHLVHEGGWTLTITSDRIATWTRPDGTVHHRGPCADRPPPTSSSP